MQVIFQTPDKSEFNTAVPQSLSYGPGLTEHKKRLVTAPFSVLSQPLSLVICL